jgi:hypothetical protein
VLTLWLNSINISESEADEALNKKQRASPKSANSKSFKEEMPTHNSERSLLFRKMTATRVFQVLAKDYPPPIERLRVQVTLPQLAQCPTLLDKFKRLHNVSIFITSL